MEILIYFLQDRRKPAVWRFGRTRYRSFNQENIETLKKNLFNPLVHGRFSRPILKILNIEITHIENGIKRFLYIQHTHSLPLIFLKNFSVLMVLGLKKASTFAFFKNVKTKIFIFVYFPKFPSEINSTHPFYPILILNTPYVKFSLFFQGVPKI